MSNHLVKNTLKLMTVKEVAAVLQMDQRTVQLKVKELFPNIVKNGVTTMLTQAQVTAVKLDLEKKFEVKTLMEKELIIQQALMFQNEKISEMQLQLSIKEEQLQIQAPKVEFFDTVTKLDSWLTFKEVANMLNLPNLGRNNLTKKLRELKYINDFNKPYQRYIDQKLFKVIETVKGNNVYTSTVVSQKGLDKLIKVLNEK